MAEFSGSLGAILIVNGKKIVVERKDVEEAAGTMTGNWVLGLPDGVVVQLGTVREDFDILMKIIHSEVRFEDIARAVPNVPLFANIVNVLGDLELAIETLSLKHTAKKDAAEPPKPATTTLKEDAAEPPKPATTTFEIRVTLTLPNPPAVVPGLAFDGVVLDVSATI